MIYIDFTNILSQPRSNNNLIVLNNMCSTTISRIHVPVGTMGFFVEIQVMLSFSQIKIILNNPPMKKQNSLIYENIKNKDHIVKTCTVGVYKCMCKHVVIQCEWPIALGHELFMRIRKIQQVGLQSVTLCETAWPLIGIR